jgi:hypothetical protein
MKIRPMRAELFHADRRTDMAKLIVPFRNLANEPLKPALVYFWVHPRAPLLSTPDGRTVGTGYLEFRVSCSSFTLRMRAQHIKTGTSYACGPGSSVGIATDYRLDDPGIESVLGAAVGLWRVVEDVYT